MNDNIDNIKDKLITNSSSSNTSNLELDVTNYILSLNNSSHNVDNEINDERYEENDMEIEINDERNDMEIDEVYEINDEENNIFIQKSLENNNAIENSCIICLEASSPNSIISSETVLRSIDCECKYKLHRKCYYKWCRHKRNIKCLVCGSNVVKILPTRENINEEYSVQNPFFCSQLCQIISIKCFMYGFVTCIIFYIFIEKG